MEMESKKGSEEKGVYFQFQMPLHYPRYTSKDYQEMPEAMLDRLLAQYGLSVPAAAAGDLLAHKRDFAIGAFLWPLPPASDSSSCLHNTMPL